MIISANGINLIKEYERYFPEAYRCPKGIWTIGWGSTRYSDGSPVRQGDKITTDHAERLLHEHLFLLESEVSSVLKVPVSQGQFDALVSFAYNCGMGALKGSTLLKTINDNKNIDISMFVRWSKIKTPDGSKTLPGLVRRRLSEHHLFTTGELKFEFT